MPSPQSKRMRSPPARRRTAGRPRRAVGAEPPVPAKKTGSSTASAHDDELEGDPAGRDRGQAHGVRGRAAALGRRAGLKTWKPSATSPRARACACGRRRPPARRGSACAGAGRGPAPGPGSWTMPIRTPSRSTVWRSGSRRCSAAVVHVAEHGVHRRAEALEVLEHLGGHEVAAVQDGVGLPAAVQARRGHGPAPPRQVGVRDDGDAHAPQAMDRAARPSHSGARRATRLGRPSARSSVDRARASGARGRRFESCRARWAASVCRAGGPPSAGPHPAVVTFATARCSALPRSVVQIGVPTIEPESELGSGMVGLISPASNLQPLSLTTTPAAAVTPTMDLRTANLPHRAGGRPDARPSGTVDRPARRSQRAPTRRPRRAQQSSLRRLLHASVAERPCTSRLSAPARAGRDNRLADVCYGWASVVGQVTLAGR